MRLIVIATRAAATALVLAPLAWACMLFATDLHERPSGRRAVAIAGGEVEVPLEEGRTVAIPLAADSIPYRGVTLRFRVAAPAQVTLRLCGRSSCDERPMEVRNGEVAFLAVPSDAAAGGGALSLTATAVSKAPVALRGDPATPAVEVVQGYSWRLPARRAREVFHAFAGADVFLAALGACALALAAGLVACCVLAFRTAAADKPTGSG
jgi:hypothetical protein